MKLLRTTAIAILVVASLSFYGFAVQHVVFGQQRLGSLTQPLKNFISLPDYFFQSFSKNTDYHGRVSISPGFEPVHSLEEDVLCINSHLNLEDSVWVMRLINLRNQKEVYHWSFQDEKENTSNRELFLENVPNSFLLLGDTSIVFQLFTTPDLVRLNKNEEVVWKTTVSGNLRRGLSLGIDGNLWVCSSQENSFGMRLSGYRYFDNTISKINTETGKTIFSKSISEILVENDFHGLLLGSNETEDPIHLNDIDPVDNNTPYWQKGDLFLSLKNMSIIMHYRPSTNAIIRLIQGSFIAQNNISLISDHELVIFDNRSPLVGREAMIKIPKSKDSLLYTTANPRTLVYDFKTETYYPLEEQFFESHPISHHSGLFHSLGVNQFLIEDQGSGNLYILDNGKIVFSDYLGINSQGNYREKPHHIWISKSFEGF